MFDFVHILKSIRNNWINLKNINQTFIHPDLSTINLSHIAYPLRINAASFDDIRQQYLSEKHKVAKLAPRLTAKSCWPTSLERQNVKLALKIFDESTLAAISLRNEANHNSQTEDFINIILKLWKIFNINGPNKDLRFKDDFSRQLFQNDERFSFLYRIVYWIDVWKALPGKGGKLSPQTFTSLKHSCLALPILVNFLTSECRFNYVLSYFLQTDPIEHHFGLYRMLSGANYHISLCQILESERRLKVSDILNLFSQQPTFKQTALQNFIQSFSPEDEYHWDNIDLTPFLSELLDLSTIFLDTTTLQSLAYIAGYSVHQNLKLNHNCELCRDLLTISQDIILEPSKYKLIEFMDRGGLKWPSDIALSLVILVWKIFISIEGNQKIWEIFVIGRCRNILVELSKNLLQVADSDHWRNTCPQCDT